MPDIPLLAASTNFPGAALTDCWAGPEVVAAEAAAPPVPAATPDGAAAVDGAAATVVAAPVPTMATELLDDAPAMSPGFWPGDRFTAAPAAS